MVEQDEFPEDQAQEFEQRLEKLETEMGELRNDNAVQGLVIQQYRKALENANYQNAILTAKLNIATQPTE